MDYDKISTRTLNALLNGFHKQKLGELKDGKESTQSQRDEADRYADYMTTLEGLASLPESVWHDFSGIGDKGRKEINDLFLKHKLDKRLSSAGDGFSYIKVKRPIKI